MGVFDFLFGSKKRTKEEVIPDLIWMTTVAKFAGLAKEAEERSRSETVAIQLLAHFPAVLARLEEIASQKVWGVPRKPVSATNLNPGVTSSLFLFEPAIIDIIVGERHPLASVDDLLEEFGNELPCRCRISHHVSLEDAVMKVFLAFSF